MAGSVLLVVVDDPAHRALFNRYLGNTPHHLIFSHDGEDGFDRFSEVKPDLVIAHVNAPRLDGTILCQLIRQQPRGETTPFVLLGEEFKDPELGAARVAVVGADGFLPCPFERRALIERITPLLAFGRPDPSQLPLDPEMIEAPSRPSSSTAIDSREEELSEVVAAIEAHASGVMEAATEDPSVEAPVAERSQDLLGEQEAPPRASAIPIPEAQDTVVSFQNPYGAVQPPELSLRPPISVLPPQENTSPSLEPEVATHIEDRPTTPFKPPLRTALFTDRAKAPDVAPMEPEFDEVPREEGREQLLEEPQISAVVPRIPDHSKEDSDKARMLHEPSRDGTPSTADRRNYLQRDPAAASRRGLDESQLGKRLSKRVRALYRLIDQVDYYQVLGVEPSASPEQLRRAYFDLSLEFHPDRFFLLRSGDLKEKIYAVYRRITEAYTVLSDERRRQSYDDSRKSGSSEKRAAPDQREERVRREVPSSGKTLEVPARDAKAKRLIELARIAFSEGDLHGARLHLHLALTYETDNAQLRAAIDSVAKMSRPTA